MRSPNYRVVEETDEYMLIEDLGPWDVYPTVSNCAEQVVEQLAERLGTRRLEYIDSTGDRDEIVVVNGKYAGFKPVQNRKAKYPAGWPKCPGCGRPALDGHITCGDANCDEGGRRNAVADGR